MQIRTYKSSYRHFLTNGCIKYWPIRELHTLCLRLYSRDRSYVARYAKKGKAVRSWHGKKCLGLGVRGDLLTSETWRSFSNVHSICSRAEIPTREHFGPCSIWARREWHYRSTSRRASGRSYYRRGEGISKLTFLTIYANHKLSRILWFTLHLICAGSTWEAAIYPRLP
jgi:hypothetical protein